ncbi:MAG: DEAD/DEAH box helicase [Nocardioidaceae bacterium]
MAASRPHSHASTRPASSTPIGVAPTFTELGVPSPLVKALARVGVTEPFPIQTATLPDSLAGRDLLGRGRTGSGKTYAFLVPMLARLAASPTHRRPSRPRALILAPTRELATQISAAMAPLASALSLRSVTVFGGVGAAPQIKALKTGVDIVVACPGRLADHVQQGHAVLDAVEVTVLDEADHMADLGFLPVVRRLLDTTPAKGQRMLFSATLDSGVDVLAKRYLTNPVTHEVDPVESASVEMTHHVLHVDRDSRLPVLVDLASAPGRTLVFTRTRHGAKQLAKKLTAAGVPALEMHGDLSQAIRTRNLKAFSTGASSTLVATDIAARGIHVDDVRLVIHADPPAEHKAYLHRSGRTARAGASGTVVTLMVDSQVSDVRSLTRKAGVRPTTTRLGSGHPLLGEIAPGQRVLVAPSAHSSAAASTPSSGDGRGGPRRGGRSGTSTYRSGGKASGSNSAGPAAASARHRRPSGQRSHRSVAR